MYAIPIAPASEIQHSLWVGPGLVLAAVSDNWSSKLYDEPPIGAPACEMWTDEAWRPVHAAMREVYATGKPLALRGVLGLFTILPVEWQGSRALVVELQPSQRMLQPVPTLRDLLALRQ